MSGSVSGSQFNFVPRASVSTTETDGAVDAWSGAAGREYKGPRSVAPLASGAFSSQDRALAYRHQGGEVLSHGAKNIGSWLFKNEG